MRFVAILLTILLVACDTDFDRLDKVDPTGNLGRDDYRALRAPQETDPGPPRPYVPAVRGRVPQAKIAQDKTISLAVTEKMPLRDVLQELAHKADLNLELDPRISGGVIFSASRQPFSKVLERLCRMAGLRYSYEDGFLRVEIDEAFVQTYAIDYLSLIRKSRSEMGIATNVFSSVQNSNSRSGSGASGNDAVNGNNSTTKLETEASADFWAEIEGNVGAILANTRLTRHLAVDEKAVAETQGIPAGKSYTLNRQAGLLTVFGTQRQQQAVEAYMEKVKRSVKSQVLIEARIIEVQLDENYRGGINWRTLFDGSLNIAARFGAVAVGAPFATAATATDGVVTMSLKDNDFGGILNFVRGFGTSRTLSSPRLTVLNNQPAVLKVARNEVYFTSTIETTPIIGSGGGSPVAVQRTVNSTPNTVPVGFLMTVQPSINPDTQEVTLNLRPTVSFIVDRVEDPGIKIAAADANVPEITSSIPVVAVREMDSVLTVQSGSVAVMGGLMQDSTGNIESGAPFIDETPIIGNLGKSRSNDSTLSELVILLRATIVDEAPKPDLIDAELYHTYTQDRRTLPIPRPRRRIIPLNDIEQEELPPEEVIQEKIREEEYLSPSEEPLSGDGNTPDIEVNGGRTTVYGEE
jgi:MSHA type pilus biogenesis protein MshL